MEHTSQDERRPISVAAGQADGIQPRTIEVLQSYGLADKLLARGNHQYMIAFYNTTKDGKGIERTSRTSDISGPAARFPYKILLNQGGIERLFLDSMRENGLEVERPVIPTNLRISEDPNELADPSSFPVTVTIQRLPPARMEDSIMSMDSDESATSAQDASKDEELLHAKYVIGADGAHSWVRDKLGIQLDGEHTNHVWAVVDCVPVTDFPDIRNKAAIHSSNGSIMLIPREGDKVRLYVQLAEGLDVETTGRMNKSAVTPRKIMEVAKKSMSPFRLEFPEDPEWWTVYVISQRVARQFSAKERVFIAGDACHTHSPKAGQGMNASMNDTHNLTWKLVHVLRGWASPKLLKTYEFERRKFAQELIDFDRKLADMWSGKASSGKDTEGVSPQEFQGLLQTMGGFTSGIGIHYEPSIISNSQFQPVAEGLVVGERVPPQIIIRIADCRPYNLHDLLVSDTKWKLLYFVGDLKEVKQAAVVRRVGQHLLSPRSFMKRFTPNQAEDQTMFTTLTISCTPKEDADYTDIPNGLRTHWSKAFTDDISVDRKSGGRAYETYRVSRSAGAVAAVRPDGYVGCVCSLEDVAAGHLDAYFAEFMEAST